MFQKKNNFLMNKIYLFTAAFAVMASLSGCSDTELASIDTAQEKTPIGFHTVGSQMGSRADVINSGNLKDYSFNVYAFTRNSTDGSDVALFMGTEDKTPGTGGIKISHNGTKWDYATSTDLKYWPTNALNFYAVSPAKDPILYTWQISQTKKEISYWSSDEYGGEHPYTDVMYAIATNQSKSNNGGKVQLKFRHITSQVVFKAKKQLSNMVVEIKSIKLHNLETSGVFTIPTNRTDLQPQRLDWTPQNLINTKGLSVINLGNDDPKITIGTEATDISTDKPMFLIPQKSNKWDTSNDINTANTKKQSYLSIECKISIDGSNIITETTGEKLYVPFEADWQPGKRYVYTLVFGGGYDKNGKPILQSINFEPSVGEWVEDNKNSTPDNDIPLYQQ